MTFSAGIHRPRRWTRDRGAVGGGAIGRDFRLRRNTRFTDQAELVGFDFKRNKNPTAVVPKVRSTVPFLGGPVNARGYETVTAGNTPSPLSIAGMVIRYGFYAVGMLVLGLIGLAIMAMWKIPPKAIDAPPAFRISAPSLSRLPVSGSVTTSSLLGRAEVRQYGRLSNRDIDLAVALIMPPKGVGMGNELIQDLRNVNMLS